MTRRARLFAASLLVALALLGGASRSLAAGDAPEAAASPEALFQQASAALGRGEHTAAVDALEALADRGFVHPDASYNRGLAYVQRVRARSERPGDLGRAAAAFDETLRLRDGDADAELALDLVRAEVARRQARRHRDVMQVRPTIDRMLVGLASETTWSLAAVVASALLALGLVLRRRPAGAAHVTGSVLAPIAALALAVLVPLAWGARTLRVSTRPGVVVAPEAYLTDETGRSLGGTPLPEAASVEAGRRSGELLRVRWGPHEGWVPVSAVRLLQR